MQKNNKELSLKNSIEDWLFQKIKKIENIEKNWEKDKWYIHFDKKPYLIEGITLGESLQKQEPQIFFEDFLSAENIAKRWFWPFIRTIKEEKKYDRKINDENESYFNIKERQINSASHFDSYIYSYYSYILNEKYNKLLSDLPIDKEVLAYRKLWIEWKKWNKNNIYFAKDSFEEINKQQDCFVFTFDISWFFDNLDWKILKEKLAYVLDIENLWSDWNNILNSITKFSYIEKDNLKKYGLIANNNSVIDKKEFSKAKKEYKKNNPWFKLVVKNQTNKWIAQWIWISQNLANIYMLDFDLYISDLIKKLWWKYYRYSDDILIVAKYDINNKEKIFSDIQNEVFDYIKKIKLDIQPKKTDIFDFNWWILTESFTYDEDIELFKKDINLKPLQYLWFSFDWKNILVRNKTITKHYWKMNYALDKYKDDLNNYNRAYKYKQKLKERKKSWKNQGMYLLNFELKNNYLNLFQFWNIKIKSDLKLKMKELNKRFTHSWILWKWNEYSNFYWYMNQSQKIMEEIEEKKWINIKIIGQMSKYQNNYNKALKKKGIVK
jgi:RNA-directed DNA polymerase